MKTFTPAPYHPPPYSNVGSDMDERGRRSSGDIWVRRTKTGPWHSAVLLSDNTAFGAACGFEGTIQDVAVVSSTYPPTSDPTCQRQACRLALWLGR